MWVKISASKHTRIYVFWGFINQRSLSIFNGFSFFHTAKHVNDDGSEDDEEGTCNFMVNVIEPQFNLHSEEANVSF